VRHTGWLHATLIGLLMLASCATPLQWGNYPSGLVDIDTAGWQADIAWLRSELPKRNPHFAADTAMAATFDAAAVDLLGRVPDLLDAHYPPGTQAADRLVVELARLIALAGEGHTSLNMSSDMVFPVLVRWFPEGLFVIAADEQLLQDNPMILGTMVRAIQRPDGLDMLVEDNVGPGLESLLNSVIAVDHPNGYRPQHGTVLMNPVLARGLGLAAEELVYVLDDGTGADPLRVRVSASPWSAVSFRRVNADQAAPRPLSHSSARGNWYVVGGPDGRTLYLRYDSCVMDAYALFQSVLNELKRGPVERLIVDLRWNSGGTSLPGSWFAHQVAGIPAINKSGALFVLIGPGTFSSGMMLAVDFMAWTKAIFAGQPLAQGPDSWGEVKRFALPNSGLVVGHSSRLWRYSRGKNLRLNGDGLIEPDPGFAIETRFAEYVDWLDPVLDAVLPTGANYQ
jgi:hypothetical protein